MGVPAASSRDVGPLATDQTSMTATNSGTASAIDPTRKKRANSRPTAAASMISATFAAAPTCAGVQRAREQPGPQDDEQRSRDRVARRQQRQRRRGDEQQPDPAGDEDLGVAGGQRGQRGRREEVRERDERDADRDGCRADPSPSRRAAQYGGRSAYHSPSTLKADQNARLAASSSSASSMFGT